jgi:hypothetical protein
VTQSAALRLAGFRSNLSISGEELKLAGVCVLAIVNRNVVEPKDALSTKDGKIDFSVMGMSSIEFTICDNAQPAVGAFFYDDVGFKHRVTHVTHSDITWTCYCQPSQQ